RRPRNARARTEPRARARAATFDGTGWQRGFDSLGARASVSASPRRAGRRVRAALPRTTARASGRQRATGGARGKNQSLVPNRALEETRAQVARASKRDAGERASPRARALALGNEQ